jgi:hypothetical protein
MQTFSLALWFLCALIFMSSLIYVVYEAVVETKTKPKKTRKPYTRTGKHWTQTPRGRAICAANAAKQWNRKSEAEKRAQITVLQQARWNGKDHSFSA